MSTVATYSYTHSVTYVTDNILKSLKDIILLSGLDPSTSRIAGRAIPEPSRRGSGPVICAR